MYGPWLITLNRNTKAQMAASRTATPIPSSILKVLRHRDTESLGGPDILEIGVTHTSNEDRLGHLGGLAAELEQVRDPLVNPDHQVNRLHLNLMLNHRVFKCPMAVVPKVLIPCDDRGKCYLGTLSVMLPRVGGQGLDGLPHVLDVHTKGFGDIFDGFAVTEALKDFVVTNFLEVFFGCDGH